MSYNRIEKQIQKTLGEHKRGRSLALGTRTPDFGYYDL